MKKVLLYTILLLWGFAELLSAPVNENQALKIAINFFGSKENIQESMQIKLAYKSPAVELGSENQIQSGTTAYYYVYNKGDKSFVIIAGDDASYPILSYSNSSNFDPDNLAPNAAKWLENYKEQMRVIIKNKMQATAEIKNEWANLENEKWSQNQIQASVSPMLTTTWDQSDYYNTKCPYDNNYKKRTYTGCVATAMAQLLKFWNYPKAGTGFHGYTHDQYGYLSANFGATSYDWASMPNSVTSSNDAVATLMYHCGVSVEMNYGTSASGAWVILDNPAKTEYCTENALKTFFGYDSGLKGVKRDNYSESDWINMLTAELNAGRPVLYDGCGGSSGHAFVCDGYNSNYFHFNWGWSGMLNGYFLVNQLNPGSGGSGSGEGTYNQFQEMVIGVKPPQTNTKAFDLQLYDNVLSDKYDLFYGDSFTITTDVANFGTGAFSGNFCAAIFDADENFVDFVQTLSNYQLQSNNHFTNGLTFTNAGLFSMIPGTYYVFIFYSTDGQNWNLIQGNSQIPYQYATINVFNDNPLELASDMTTTPSMKNIFQNGPLSIFMDITNNSSSTFYGDLVVNLYKLNGDYVGTFGTYSEKNGLPPTYHYTSPLEYHIDNLAVEPGTYLVAGIYQVSGTQNSFLLGSGNGYKNPFKIIIQSPLLSPDSYEPNNTVAASKKLNIIYSSNQAAMSTKGSNIHNSEDVDVYRLDFASGYNYSLNSGIEDIYTVPNGGYTLDGVFLYSYDGLNWSETYDNELPSPISFSGPKTLYVKAIPFLLGDRGTYQLDFAITRSPSNSVEDKTLTGNYSLSPNPASENITISSNNPDLLIKQVKIFDETGNLINSIECNLKNTVQIKTDNLTNGSYFCNVSDKNGNEIILKFMVKK